MTTSISSRDVFLSVCVVVIFAREGKRNGKRLEAEYYRINLLKRPVLRSMKKIKLETHSKINLRSIAIYIVIPTFTIFPTGESSGLLIRWIYHLTVMNYWKRISHPAFGLPRCSLASTAGKSRRLFQKTTSAQHTITKIINIIHIKIIITTIILKTNNDNNNNNNRLKIIKFNPKSVAPFAHDREMSYLVITIIHIKIIIKTII